MYTTTHCALVIGTYEQYVVCSLETTVSLFTGKHLVIVLPSSTDEFTG